MVGDSSALWEQEVAGEGRGLRNRTPISQGGSGRPGPKSGILPTGTRGGSWSRAGILGSRRRQPHSGSTPGASMQTHPPLADLPHFQWAAPKDSAGGSVWGPEEGPPGVGLVVRGWRL